MRTFFALLFLGLPVWAQDTSQLLHVGCENKAGESLLRVENEMLLNQNFLPEGMPSAESVNEAVKLQMRYFAGNFYNLEQKEVRLVISEPDSRVESFKITEGRYGRNLTVDDLKHPNYQTDDAYQMKAITRGFTRSGDKAWKIRYVAQIKVAACLLTERAPSSIKIFLPRDPYLFYWSVPPQERRDIRWRNSAWKVNPCANSEVADLPHPLYFWHFWNPKMTGLDAHQNAFDCRKILKEGQDYSKVSVPFQIDREPSVKSQALQLDQLPSSRPLRASLYFGVIDPASKLFPIATFAKAFAGRVKNASPKLQNFLDAQQLSPGAWTEQNWDRGSQYFANFLHSLPEVLRVSSLQILQKSDNTLLLKFNGKLAQSGSPIEMQVFFGPTDVFSQPEPQHWKHFSKALSHDDIILYSGHSGLGHNLSLASMGETLGLTPQKLEKELRVSHYQLIGFLSCYSYSYFGADLREVRSRTSPGSVADYVYTGSEFTSERGPLGILSHIDHYRAGQKNDSLAQSQYLHPRDFIIVKKFGLSSAQH